MISSSNINCKNYGVELLLPGIYNDSADTVFKLSPLLVGQITVLSHINANIINFTAEVFLSYENNDFSNSTCPMTGHIL